MSEGYYIYECGGFLAAICAWKLFASRDQSIYFLCGITCKRSFGRAFSNVGHDHHRHLVIDIGSIQVFLFYFYFF